MAESSLSRFIKGIISIGFGNVLLMILGVAGTMVVARRLPEDEYGTFVLAMVVATFLAQMSSFGLDLAVVNFMIAHEDRDIRTQMVNTVVWFRLFTIAAASLLAILARPLLSALFGELMSSTILFIPLLFFVGSLTNILKAILQGLFQFKRIGLADAMAGVLNFSLILFFVIVLDRGAVGLVYATVLARIVSCLFMFWSIPLPKGFTLDRPLLKKLIRFGFPLQINDILSFIYTRMDTLVIGLLLSPTAIAQYEIARKIPDNLRSLFEAFRSVYFPFMSRLIAQGERRKVDLLLNTANRLIALASIFVALLCVIFGRELIVLLFSDKYAASGPAFIMLMIVLSISFVGNILGTSLVAAGDTNKPAIINTVHSTFSLITNLLLVAPLGIVGAAVANLVGNIVSNPLNVFYLRRNGIAARFGPYVKPFAIFAAYALLAVLWEPQALLYRLLIVAAYLLTNIVLQTVTLEDFAALRTEIRPALPRRLQRLIPRSHKA